jgi:hypothetical protein
MDVERLREAAVARAVEGDGKATREQRTDAFAGTLASPLFAKVREHAYKVTAADIAAAKQTSSEDEIFELAVCSAYGKADRQLAAALAAIAEVG